MKKLARTYGPFNQRVEDKTRCVTAVHGGDRFPTFYQCQRKRQFGPNKEYCKIHDPAAVEARQRARAKRYEEAQRRAEWPQREIGRLRREVGRLKKAVALHVAARAERQAECLALAAKVEGAREARQCFETFFKSVAGLPLTSLELGLLPIWSVRVKLDCIREYETRYPTKVVGEVMGITLIWPALPGNMTQAEKQVAAMQKVEQAALRVRFSGEWGSTLAAALNELAATREA